MFPPQWDRPRSVLQPADQSRSASDEPSRLIDGSPAQSAVSTTEASASGLQLVPATNNVPSATPVKRRGKSMSRRSGQSGHVEQSGKWWVVRWWMDVPGQEKRAHNRAKVCPISGPGSLSKSARQRRAREIIAESGADSAEYFNKTVRPTGVKTFREQGANWLEFVAVRKRKPVAPSTIEDWERTLRNWLYPNIGDLPLAEVNNGAMKKIVSVMSEAGLSAKTIETYTGVAKMVVASDLNAEGEQVCPRKWNHEFIDMPLVQQSKQNTPTFSSDVMTSLATWKKPRERMLFILCGAAGLRIGEALGIEIDKHISLDFSIISVRQKARHCRIEARLKTPSAEREVDLHPAISRLLKVFVGERRSGFLFTSRNGKPISSSNVIRRHLHPALKKINYVNPNTGTHKAGNHAFRRFRNTYLKNHTDCPKGLYDYWLGHAGKDMSDLYDKIKENIEFRKTWAERCGLGFELSPVVPNVPKTRRKSRIRQGSVNG